MYKEKIVDNTDIEKVPFLNINTTENNNIHTAFLLEIPNDTTYIEKFVENSSMICYDDCKSIN